MNVSSSLLLSNDKVIHKNDKIHGRNLQKLIPDIHETSIIDNISHDPKKVIYNFSNFHFTESEYSKFLFPFELLFNDIKFSSESSVYLARIKARLQDTAFTA